MASRRSIQHSTAGERLVSVEEALEMIHTQGSDVEEDINDSSDENFDPYSEETDVDTDTEVGADSGEEADDAFPAYKPQQGVSDSDADTYMGEEVDYFSWNPTVFSGAEIQCLKMISEVFSPFSFSFTPEKTTAHH